MGALVRTSIYIQNSFTCETSSQGSKKTCVVQRAACGRVATGTDAQLWSASGEGHCSRMAPSVLANVTDLARMARPDHGYQGQKTVLLASIREVNGTRCPCRNSRHSLRAYSKTALAHIRFFAKRFFRQASAVSPAELATTTLTRNSLVLIISTLMPASAKTSNMPMATLV